MLRCNVAHMYAKIIFDLAMRKKMFAKWKKMLTVSVQISNHQKIKHCISGILPSQYVASVFNIIGENIFNIQFKNFIHVMADNKRLNILNNVLREYMILYNNYHKIINAEIISYHALHEYQLNNICYFLEKKFNKKIEFRCTIDQSIIDGFIIKVNNIVIDMSIYNRLKQLEFFLQS